MALFRALLLDTVHKPDGQRESLGEKEIDGRRVVGFRLSDRGTVLSVWGDPKTRVPVRIYHMRGLPMLKPSRFLSPMGCSGAAKSFSTPCKPRR